MNEQRGHQNQHGKDDRDGESKIEQERRQRQDQHDENCQHADGERDVATLEEGADVAEAGKFDAAYGVCRSGGDVAHT